MRRGGLGSLPGDYLIGLVNPAAGLVATGLDITGCSLWQVLTGGCGAKVATAAMQIPNTQQILSVPANAAQYYGPNSVTAQVAQQAADEQISQLPADAASITTDYSSSFPSVPGLDALGSAASPFTGFLSTLPPWAWIAIAIGGSLVAVKVLK